MALKHSEVPESFGGPVGPGLHPAGRGAGRGHGKPRPSRVAEVPGREGGAARETLCPTLALCSVV